jgi:hypothetical protein
VEGIAGRGRVPDGIVAAFMRGKQGLS